MMPKDKIKKILFNIFIFLGVFFLWWLLSYYFFNIFYQFKILGYKYVLCISSIVSFVETIGSIVIAKKHEKGNIISRNIYWTPKIALGYVILIISLASIRNELIWDNNQLVEILNLQWVIFGISVTVFLIWQVIEMKFLSKKKKYKRKQIKDPNAFEEDIKIRQKLLFEVNSHIFTPVLLGLNTVALIIITGIYYIVVNDIAVWLQDAVICSFYLCVNTLSHMLLDIITLVFIKRFEVVSNIKITNEELDIYIKLQNIKEVNTKLMSLLEEYKKAKEKDKDKILKKITKIIGSYANNNENVSGEEKVENHDQL